MGINVKVRQTAVGGGVALDPGPQLRRAAPRMRAAILDALTLEGAEMQTEIVRTRLSGKPLRSRTGALRQSVGSYVLPQSMTLVIGAGLGKSAPYAAVHELGIPSEIRPRRAKALTIPMKAAMTPTGRERSEGRRMRKTRTGLRVGYSKKGEAFLVKPKSGVSGAAPQSRRKGFGGKNSEPRIGPDDEVWYKLVDRVRVKKRPFIKPVIDRRVPGMERTLLDLLNRGGAA
jgi:phage gpG-like protein